MDITIVGGGITGLATAYLAAKCGHQVRVLEASNQFGGLLSTFEVGGNRLEYFYHHFFTHDAEINWLIHELGLADQLTFKKTTMGVFRQGKIYDFNSPADLFRFRPIKLLDKIRFALSSYYLGKLANWKTQESIPALEWFSKRAGKTSTQSLWKPMLDIKFGPFAKAVPLAWMTGRLRQRMNSRQSGDEKLGYLKGSLDTLLQALLGSLRRLKVELIPNTPLTEIEIENGQLKSVVCQQQRYTADATLITIPGVYLANMLHDSAPALASSLKQIEYFGAVCVVLKLKQKLGDIYWLNVADEGFPFGGVIEHTNFISSDQYEGSHLVYLSRYFAHDEEIADLSDEEIQALMLPHLSRIYPNLDQENDIDQVWVFKTRTAATVCDLNFSQKVPACQTDIKNLFVCNMAHIYPDERSVNNSIRIAAEACRVMGMDASFVPRGVSLSGQIGF